MSLKEENFFPRGLKYLAWGLPFSEESQHLSNCQFVFWRKGIFLQLISDTCTLQIAGPYFQEKVIKHRNKKDVGLSPISIFLTQPCGTEVSIILGESGQYFSWPPVFFIFLNQSFNKKIMKKLTSAAWCRGDWGGGGGSRVRGVWLKQVSWQCPVICVVT